VISLSYNYMFVLTHPVDFACMWEEPGAPEENPRLSAERWLTLKSHGPVARIEPTFSEVKGACSDDCATEAHVNVAHFPEGCIRDFKVIEHLWVKIFLLVSMKALDKFYYLTKFGRKMLKTRRVI
jgi:hypothetical protein